VVIGHLLEVYIIKRQLIVNPSQGYGYGFLDGCKRNPSEKILMSVLRFFRNVCQKSLLIKLDSGLGLFYGMATIVVLVFFPVMPAAPRTYRNPFHSQIIHNFQ